MLGLFIPWGSDRQNQQFRRGQQFSSLWEELKLTLSRRLLFHVQNFDSLRKSREEVLADRSRYHSRSDDQSDSSSDVSESISQDGVDDLDDFTDQNSEETSTVSVIRRDVSSAIETISSAIDPKGGFWTRMDDLKRTAELSSALKTERGGVIGKGIHFERSAADDVTMLKEWTSALKQQASNVRKRNSGIEGDIEDDEMIGGGDEYKAGAHLVQMPQQRCKTWDEAQEEVIAELSLNEKQKRVIILIAA